MLLQPKPAFSAPCNHYGLCCKEPLCELGQLAFPGASVPCPGLDVRDDVALCSLVITEADTGMEPMLAKSLGIGCGCSMPDKDTTEAQIKEFDRVSFIKIYGRARQVA
ncbi:hypothetical protein JAB5_27590 [Janthinobacterium sp. HH103]|uniref:hypothetical protein n=1 Tax=unclassified Janthinobacterium TaxID=2610881 RepID=UPI000875139D|nr:MULTISPECIES: hypothetical protein [unclassified Janthinobacterium]OEZ52995.1 hypothetical protein JAB2_58590 [Janthinobacterium sp. HH100]OEZ76450.1 hypothetical protein JAB5_27590 [Janthinobacterium sp. HH103]QOU76182.1 hypothetical protein JAB4_056820 [Janthinobacterium sp. HH102]